MPRRAFRLAALLLLLSPASLLAQDGVPLFTQDFAPEEFTARRERVYDAVGTAGVALLQGAPSPPGYTRFRQSNEFYYLTGIEVPHAYVLLDGAARRTSLYLPHRNEARERGEGKVLSAEDAELLITRYGFDAVYGPELLAEHLGRLARSQPARTLYTPFAPAEGMAVSRDLGYRTNADIAADPWDGRPSREGHFVGLLRARFPAFPIEDLNPALDTLRLVKSPAELALIRKASRLSGLALMEAMRATAPGLREADLDAVAKYVFFLHGAQGDAYYSLIGSGQNAYFPHYNAGKRTMRDGDFLLMDYAPDVGYYMSDVTRMWPVNGRFSQGQRELYGFYLACYRAILNRIRPGVTAAQIRQEAVAEMEQILARATFSKPAYQRGAQSFVFSYRSGSFHPNASLGHWVGMATHDVGTYYGPLKPGMVFTIEPALRVPEELIYVRLEDLIIVTETGAEVVSDFVPMDIDAIEALMREEGMLQRYPKVDFSRFPPAGAN